MAPSLPSDLLGLVRCDHLLFTGSDSSRQVSWVAQLAPAEVGDWFDPAAGWKHYWSSPASYPDRSGDLRSVIKVSDFYSARQWHSTGFYHDACRPYGIEHEMMLCLPAAGSNQSPTSAGASCATQLTCRLLSEPVKSR